MTDSRIIDLFFDSGGFRLHGVLHFPDRGEPPFVIGSHGLLADADSPKQVCLAEALSEKKIAYFRFSHRGCGKSQGDLAHGIPLAKRAEDIVNALKTLSQRIDMGPFLGLFGSSMGGAASLCVAATRFVPALVTVAAPVRSREITATGPADLEPDPLTTALLKEESLRFDLSDRLSRIRNILLFHGDEDEIVPFSNALEIEKRTTPPKHLIRFEGGDHRMSDPNHQAVFVREATRWFVTAAEALSPP
ncbi:MAG: alpha/beta fold hydrolase [Deltaproteobacteria bacterium]|nr:alpha/beta fold hydrolase [Deltaproteobacteria bacterium]MBW2041838.1 alpha/beta fold hydrolase [Deltaproteobacteria bacterium]